MQTRVWVERLAVVVSAVTVGWSVLVACSEVSTTPAEPGAGCFAGANPASCNMVLTGITADGPYTITILNQTFTGSAGQVVTFVDLPLGPNTVSGTTSAATLSITFVSTPSIPGGLVQRGSIVSNAGPDGVAGPCQLTYRIPAGGTRPQVFRGAFTIATGGTAC